MINLIQPEQKKKLIAEYRMRHWAAWGILLFFLFLLEIILSGVFYSQLYYYRQGLNKFMIVEKYDLSAKSFDELNTLVGRTAERTKAIINSAAGNTPLASNLLSYALSAKTAGIKLNYLAAAPSQTAGEWIIDLRGRADNRRSLLNYLNRLKADPAAVKVESSLTDLIKEENNSFSIKFSVLAAKIPQL